MNTAAREGSSTINLSELIMLAPPLFASEVHTKLGNDELRNRYGVPAFLCQYQGKLFVSRLANRWNEPRTSPFVKLQIHTGMTMLGLIGLVAGSFEDLADCWECRSWWVVPIHRSCTSSPNKIFQSHHLLLIKGEDYWHFRLRPQGIIEIFCGEGSAQFVTTLPKNANRDIVLELLVTVLPPPALQYLTRLKLNGVELRNRLVGLDNGFYLQVEVTGNFRLGREITSTPYRLLSTLHEVPTPSIHSHSSECYCYVPGRAFFLGCRCVVVQGEKKELESQLRSQIDLRCPDFSRDAVWFKSVHSAVSDLQAVLHRSRYTVVAILLGLPADMVTVLVCLHLRRLTHTGAVWLRSENNVASVIHHLGIAQLCGVRGDAHNGELLRSDKVLLGQGDVLMFWQKDDSESMGGTVPPQRNREIIPGPIGLCLWKWMSILPWPEYHIEKLQLFKLFSSQTLYMRMNHCLN